MRKLMPLTALVLISVFASCKKNDDSSTVVPPATTPSKMYYVTEGNTALTTYEIYSADIDGSNEKKLTNFSNNGTVEKWAINPVFNADSSKLIYISATNNYDGKLMVMNLDGTGSTTFASAAGTGIIRFSTYQHGTKLLLLKDTLLASPAVHMAQVFTANIDGTNLHKLTSAPADDCLIGDVNPAANTIVYTDFETGTTSPSNPYGYHEMWLMNIDGTNKHKLTNTMFSKDEAVFSPGGSKIVFSQATTLPSNGNSEIFIINADGTNKIQLTNYSNNGTVNKYAFCPKFSKDGNSIYYSSNESGSTQIYKMNLDGTGKTKLTTVITGEKYNVIIR